MACIRALVHEYAAATEIGHDPGLPQIVAKHLDRLAREETIAEHLEPPRRNPEINRAESVKDRHGDYE